jgi:hypothetical protein
LLRNVGLDQRIVTKVVERANALVEWNWLKSPTPSFVDTLFSQDPGLLSAI